MATAGRKRVNKRIDKTATLANALAYDKGNTKKYIDGAPHIKHASLRMLYGKLAVKVFDFAAQHTKVPKVLDLGAGEGSATLTLLKLGAKVVAIDVSVSQLETLHSRCKRFDDMLEIRCEDIKDALKNKSEKYDIIVANSFLHHVPDYVAMLRGVVMHLNPYGQFISFQDPLRYDTVGKFTRFFSKVAYFSWRIFKGDLINGLKRKLRRARGVYLKDSIHDNAEYHVIRNGVDQNAIFELFKRQGIDCDIISYFSTQNSFFQTLGTFLGLKNTFAIIARKRK